MSQHKAIQLGKSNQINCIQNLGHLGLVAAAIKESGLVDMIDKIIPARSVAKTTHGERCSALILNGLGYIDTRLYMFPKFLENKPVEKLFREGIDAEDFNEFSLGRTLDKIYEYGPTKLFSEIALQIAINHNLFDRTINVDTTSLSLYGEFPTSEISQNEEPKASDRAPTIALECLKNQRPEYGYAKNKRFDLKQMILLIAKTGPANLPIHMEALSGNTSDKVSLEQATQRISKFCEELNKMDDFLFVGDSAMYTSCLNNKSKLLWLSRVPETYVNCKKVLSNNYEKWTDLENGYKFVEIDSQYSGEDIRWVLYFSQQAYDREIKTFKKNVERGQEKLSKELWHLETKKFGCTKDLELAINKVYKSSKFHEIVYEIHEVFKQAKRGKPKKDAVKEFSHYKLVWSLQENSDKIEKEKFSKGKFILASNQLVEEKLKTSDFLTEYKKQAGIESGFKFIKDNTFEIDSVFLKKSERINALMCIMTLTLLIYNLMQYNLRSKLENNSILIPAQKKNTLTEKPTMKWIFRLFEGVGVVVVKSGDGIHKYIANLTDLLIQIIEFLGNETKKIYGI